MKVEALRFCKSDVTGEDWEEGLRWLIDGFEQQDPCFLDKPWLRLESANGQVKHLYFDIEAECFIVIMDAPDRFTGSFTAAKEAFNDLKELLLRRVSSICIRGFNGHELNLRVEQDALLAF